MNVDIFLMLKENVNVKEIQDIINANFKDIEVDIWTELNVLQLELKDKTYIDLVEMINDDAFDTKDNEYFQSRGFKSVYCITHTQENLQIVLDIIKLLIEKYDGILANDTDDFEPIFDKTTLNNFNYNL